ncbi:MAG: nucleobase:cation symporter-2 family protein [Patulibacter sp.]
MSTAAAPPPSAAKRSGGGGRPEDEMFPPFTLFGYGLQHILSMFGGVIAVPIIVGGAAGLAPAQQAMLISCALFVGGLATLVQTLGLPYIGAQLPLVQGISFAAVATMTSIIAEDGTHGLRTVFGAVMVASLICFLLAPFFSSVIRFFPPVVTGSIITVIGLSLMPVAVGWVTGQATLGGEPNPAYLDMGNMAMAAVTLVLVLVLTKIPTLSRVAILLGLFVGTIIALIVGKATTANVGGSIFAIPSPFHFGAPIFEAGAIISMVVVMLVIMVETTADLLAVGEIVETDVDSKRIANGLRADMLSSAVAPIFNSFPASAFAQNVGLVALTGIKSRFVVAAGGVTLAVLGLSPMLAELVRVIPNAVLGGAGIVLFGTVAASGIRTLSKVDYQNNNNMVIVAVAIGFGLLPIANHDFWSVFPEAVATVFDSEISAAAIVAVLLNLFYNVWLPGTPEEPTDLAAAPPRLVQEEEAAALAAGEVLEGGVPSRSTTVDGA